MTRFYKFSTGPLLEITESEYDEAMRQTIRREAWLEMKHPMWGFTSILGAYICISQPDDDEPSPQIGDAA